MNKVAKKIVEVMKRVDYLQKDGKVAYGKTRYSYLSEEKITTSIRQALIEVGLTIYPIRMEIVGEKEVSTKSGTSTVLTISATYRIQDTDSEEYIEVQTIGEGMDSGDKTAYKAMTGAFKYAQRQTFAIPTGDDPDKTASDELLGGERVVTLPVRKNKIKWPHEVVEDKQEATSDANFPAFWANVKNLGYTEEDVHRIAGVDSLKGFSQRQLNSLLIQLNKKRA